MKVRIAKKEMAEAISTLRMEAYKVATNATLNDNSFLKWDAIDDESLVLYIEDDLGNPISSMRGIYVESAEEIEALFDISINGKLEFPMFLIDRLTTDIKFRRQGLSGVFRYIYIDACLKSKVKNIAFTINDGASRIPRMKKIGFTFERADLSKRQKSVYNNTSDVLLAMLGKEKFKYAQEVAKDDLKIDLNSVEIEDGFYEAFASFLAGSPVLV